MRKILETEGEAAMAPPLVNALVDALVDAHKTLAGTSLSKTSKMKLLDVLKKIVRSALSSNKDIQYLVDAGTQLVKEFAEAGAPPEVTLVTALSTAIDLTKAVTAWRGIALLQNYAGAGSSDVTLDVEMIAAASSDETIMSLQTAITVSSKDQVILQKSGLDEAIGEQADTYLHKRIGEACNLWELMGKKVEEKQGATLDKSIASAAFYARGMLSGESYDKDMTDEH